MDFLADYATIRTQPTFGEKEWMQMKRIVCLVLALCLAAMVLSGCGDKEKEENTSSVGSEVSNVTSTSPSPEPQMAKALRVTADSGLNVRKEASTDSEILGLAENGSRLALLLEDAQNGWYQVQYEGRAAYVSADYAEVIEVTLEEYNQLKGGTQTTSSSSSEDGSSATPSPAPGENNNSTSSQGGTSSSPSSDVDSEDGE